MTNILAYLAQVNWATPSWDIFILLFFIVGSILYGLALGRDRIVVILIAIYISIAVVTNTPMLTSLPGQLNLNNTVFQIAFFVALFIVLFFLLSRSTLLKTISGHGTPGSWWQTTVFSILQVGLLISVTLSLLPKELTQGLSEVTKGVFLTEQGRSAWMVLPILIMIFAPKTKREVV